jgi:hypothetical protein
MCLGYVKVVGLDRHGFEDCGDEAFATLPPRAFRALDPYLQLGHGDRRYRDVVTVLDHSAQEVAIALGVDQDRGVEN